ncbi:MAG: hypothetical protein LUC44_01700 [Prevotellaceae bacterium]|nr:hypothetical protein [Prevotellaceae bacterium]
MKNTIICLFALSLCVVACTHKPTDEEQGAKMLSLARELLQKGNTSAARDTIMSLRQRFPRAVDARRQAILTLDSVELLDAQREQDTLKIEFFERKIETDLQAAK